jgi:hypothetical protein
MDYDVINTSERKGNGFNDLTGNKYGRLTVVGLSPKKSGRKSFWVCKCICGNEHLVRSDSLKSGNVQSCGCLKKEQDRENLTKYHRHKESHTHLHDTWLGIKARVSNPNNKSYGRYGGRGIKMCDDWFNSYESFRDWAKSNGYDESLTIERIDVNGNYEPDNCTWIPWSEQANNRRSTIWIEWEGKRQNATQWAKELGFKPKTIMERYNKGQRPPYLFRELEQ